MTHHHARRYALTGSRYGDPFVIMPADRKELVETNGARLQVDPATCDCQSMAPLLVPTAAGR